MKNIPFIWAHKRPRINRRQLTLPKLYGGLAVPDLRKYQQATHLSRLIDWNRHSTTKLWTQLEQAQCTVPLDRAPWCHDLLPRDMKSHPLIGVTTRICSSLFARPHLTSLNTPLRPILGTPEFNPGCTDPIFRSLRNAGYSQVSHYIVGGRWPSIEELMRPEGPFHLDFLRALQLKHFLKTLPPPENFDRTLTTYEIYCSGEGVLPHTLSATYQLLITSPENYQIPTLRTWERDMQCNFTSRQKQNILYFTFKSSICTKMQETNYKLVTRWYNTPDKLQKIFPSSSGICWRCGEEQGMIIHVFWTCRRLEQFWKSIQQTIQKFTERQVVADPGLFLLHARLYHVQKDI